MEKEKSYQERMNNTTLILMLMSIFIIMLNQILKQTNDCF